MRNDLVLITGGAGFLGSHLADELLANGYRVRVLDSLDPQVHEETWKRPDYLDESVELYIGDVRDEDALAEALKGVTAVFHFAAAVGIGQSMYQISRYTDVNNIGTAILMEALSRNPVEKLIVASSMSVYGEGLYMTPDGTPVEPTERRTEQLQSGVFELSHKGQPLQPLPTPESKRCFPSSVYALGKYDQEKLCLICGRAYRFPVVALRFFNAYGPRQSLSNPYTGVMAIFASRLINKLPPMIFEDGNQYRDFVHVKDAARACRLALETDQANGRIFNIGSGKPYTINHVVTALASAMGKEKIGVEITGKFRVGDIRHCYADISAANEVLKYVPLIDLPEGLADFAQWLEGRVSRDQGQIATQELFTRGLSR